jgi:hypothetical protein
MMATRLQLETGYSRDLAIETWQVDMLCSKMLLGRESVILQLLVEGALIAMRLKTCLQLLCASLVMSFSASKEPSRTAVYVADTLQDGVMTIRARQSPVARSSEHGGMVLQRSDCCRGGRVVESMLRAGRGC